MQSQQPTPLYRYRLKSTGDSSARFGKCEVCDQYASDVFIQAEERQYWSVLKQDWGWTYHQCRPHLFGHEQCLKSKQR